MHRELAGYRDHAKGKAGSTREAVGPSWWAGQPGSRFSPTESARSAATIGPAERPPAARGDDLLTGGPGPDTLRGGHGDDFLFTRDHSADTALCGSGGDSAV